MERWNVTWNLPHEKPRRMPCPLGSLTDGRPRDGSAVPDMHLLTPGFLFLLGTGCQQRAESHRLRPACFTTSAAADKRALHRQTRRHNGGEAISGIYKGECTPRTTQDCGLRTKACSGVGVCGLKGNYSVPVFRGSQRLAYGPDSLDLSGFA